MSDVVQISREGKVGILTINRPDVFNALNDEVIDHLVGGLEQFDQDETIHCVMICGSEKSFAAGTDIDALQGLSYADVFKQDFVTRNWDKIRRIRKPLMAVVSGFALGGGCELAMLCDLVMASDTAKFGQPEVKLGTMPGAGGTQRLPRAIGKAKAMDICLTGRMLSAVEAEQFGLVSRVFPASELLAKSLEVAIEISNYSLPSLMMIKESINQSYEGSLADGMMYERRLFHSSFALEDIHEGITAFVEKRKPQFKNR